MPITPENLPKHELIGLEVEVTKATDEKLIGIKGEVLNETQSLLIIEGKQIEKKNCTFQFILPDGKEIKLDGELITKKPEERVEMNLPDT